MYYIGNDFGYILELDGLRAAIIRDGEKRYNQAIPFGGVNSDGDYYIYNHLDLKVTINRNSTNLNDF